MNTNIIAILGGLVLLVFVIMSVMALAMPTVSSATQFLEDRGYEVIPATFATDITAIKAKTDNLPWYPANEVTSLNIAGNQTTIIAKTNLIPASGIAEQSTLLNVSGNTTLIRAKTDLITSDPATQTYLGSIGSNITIINGTVEAIETDVEYAEQHLHHRTAWYGKLATANATHWADINTLTSPYVATSGNNAWGTGGTDPAELFGTGDELPELGTLNSGDFAQIYVIANSSDTLYRFRIVWGTGTLADAITAGQWSEGVYLRKSTDTVRMPRMLECPVIPFYIGGLPIKVWLICWNASNDATMSFYIGAHGYNL